MREAKNGDRVKVHYTGKFEGGEVFDTSVEREPLEFTIGKGQVIPGFEQAVEGMSPGDTKTTDIPPEKAYGPHHEEMVTAVERNRFPADIDPKVGQRLQLRQADGKTIRVTVTNVSGSKVTLDANHPLAGKNLTFNIKLVEIV